MNEAIVKAVLEAGEVGRLQQRLAYVGATAKVEYIGMTLPGETEGSLVWQIIKYTYDGDNIVAINYASNSSNFSFSWTARAAYFA